MQGSGQSEAPPEYQEFLAQSRQLQHLRFREFLFDKQVDLYLYQVLHRHPPYTGFALDIARNGWAAIPELLTRLKATKYDSQKHYILVVFKEMAQFYYPVKDDH